MAAPTQFVGTGWSRSNELTWVLPPLDDVVGYRIRWGTDPSQIVNQFDVSGGLTNFFAHSSKPFAIVTKAKTATVATLTTAADHGLAIGNEVVISGVDSTFNGIVRVSTVPTSKSFTYVLSGTSVVESVVRPTGLVQRTSNLPVGQTYYYRIASIYSDISQPCGQSCLSAYTSPITVDGRFGVTSSFQFTGSTATYTVPAGVEKLQVDVQGAQGGSSAAPVVGGKGGRVRATLAVTPGETLFLNVGGGGGTHFPFFHKDDVSAGFNGGGAGTGNGSGGGGASDIRRGIAITNAVLSNNVVTLTTSTNHGLIANNVIVVAGVSSVFDGTYTIAASPAPTGTTLSYVKTHPNHS
jgi:hypothetical protein